MSQENVETVRAIYQRWSEGDFRASVEFFDPNVVFVLRPEFPDAGTYSGIDAVAEYTRGFLEPWTRITIEAEEIVDVGDAVVVAVRQRGVGVQSGIGTEFRYFHAWSFQGGKVVRLENCRDRTGALEAVGLSE